MKKNYTLKVRIDEGTLSLLRELREMFGTPSLSETVRLLIVSFHVLVKAGIHRILRPIPELSQLVLEASGGASSVPPRASRER